MIRITNGWKYIKVAGKAKERGRAYGLACADDFKNIQTMLTFYMYETYGKTWPWFIKTVFAEFGGMIRKENHILQIFIIRQKI